MLEVIDKGSVSDAHPVPLLFVHGAWHAAWCWDENFLGYFADLGYRALALSFRGHGGSATDKPLRKCSVADYVADIQSVADALPRQPVVIGHSMGEVTAAVVAGSLTPADGLRVIATRSQLMSRLSGRGGQPRASPATRGGVSGRGGRGDQTRAVRRQRQVQPGGPARGRGVGMTARLMGQLIAGERPALDLAPYRVDRF